MQTKKYSDLSISLCTFLLKLVGLWRADNPSAMRRRLIMLSYTLFHTLLAIAIEVRDFYFTWINKDDIFYVLTNSLTIFMALAKIYIILIHKVEFLDLIAYMEDKFWNVNYISEEKKILDGCRKTCMFFVLTVSIVGLCVTVCYIMNPLIARSANNQSERLFLFNLWLSGPMTASPYYEMTYTLQVINMYQIGVCYFCFDTIFCIMAVHLSGQFRILQLRFTKLCNIEYRITEKSAETMLKNHIEKSYRKFKRYVQEHQALIRFCDKLENVYTLIILGQVLVFSLLICLFGYQILLTNAPPARRSIFICLMTGSMALLFMFTYSCDVVIERSDDIAIGAYSALWTITRMDKSGKMLRNDLILVMIRARRVCCLTANGFFPVSLETYTSILSTAASYFTLLRSHVEHTYLWVVPRIKNILLTQVLKDYAILFNELTKINLRTPYSTFKQRRKSFVRFIVSSATVTFYCQPLRNSTQSSILDTHPPNNALCHLKPNIPCTFANQRHATSAINFELIRPIVRDSV
ncbi:odorant receptor 4-like [Xylocopa sonorina]|uniref:odorant receptor 4-like n=1 Tax=Xylocopa sonorina TaxID=1818115 RepID=UPI00403AADB6